MKSEQLLIIKIYVYKCVFVEIRIGIRSFWSNAFAVNGWWWHNILFVCVLRSKMSDLTKVGHFSSGWLFTFSVRESIKE